METKRLIGLMRLAQRYELSQVPAVRSPGVALRDNGGLEELPHKLRGGEHFLKGPEPHIGRVWPIGRAKAAATTAVFPPRLERKLKVRHGVNQSADRDVAILETTFKKSEIEAFNLGVSVMNSVTMMSIANQQQ